MAQKGIQKTNIDKPVFESENEIITAKTKNTKYEKFPTKQLTKKSIARSMQLAISLFSM